GRSISPVGAHRLEHRPVGRCEAGPACGPAPTPGGPVRRGGCRVSKGNPWGGETQRALSEQRKDLARQLRARGLTVTQIAAQMRLGSTTVARYVAGYPKGERAVSDLNSSMDALYAAQRAGVDTDAAAAPDVRTRIGHDPNDHEQNVIAQAMKAQRE